MHKTDPREEYEKKEEDAPNERAEESTENKVGRELMEDEAKNHLSTERNEAT